jgi:AcrR family transcriptional regulator
MATTKTVEKHSEKRKAILDACLDLFCNKCYQDTSTASISQKAGVATGTLFLYFENKEEMVNELYLACKDEYLSDIEQGVWEHTTFKAQVKHIWNRNLEWKLNNRQKLKFMTQFSSSTAITDVTKEKAMTRVTLINDVVKKAVENNEVTTSSTELLAAMIWGYFHSASNFLLDQPDTKHFKKWSDESFNFFWKGIN